ncbi:CBS domain-containing protein [Arcobacter lacus]|uniref:CBS domain-containing protein n=1 Tax=Arcobacter lacus TaxID=1912876 RepID=A0ABX5JJN0_9BACT|nr:CBS domain-containing protein [Arcobacter lacus]MCT7908184.1 CBS domain-containing protein [Arcobacter lacus]MCT7912007.1 CBS domain-containing protein [Arcobacter lacus]PUE67544.1 CBS domain-containing protein [Arcobacter lacus]
MFTIYNNGTVGFRSTSDNLYNLQNVEEADSVKFDPKEGLIQDFSSELNKQQKQDFLDSYKKVANIDTLEPVYHIKDIMTKDVVYMDNKSTIEDVYNIIKSKKVHQIPITAFGKKIIGIVNKKVILNLLMDDIENAKEILKRKIDDIYLPEIITAEPESDVRRVVQIMLDLKLDAIPIVDENDILMGIVSKTDILKAVSHLPKLQLWS